MRQWVPLFLVDACRVPYARILFLLLAVAVPCAAGELEGHWVLVLERPGMLPAVSRGELVLERSGKEWSGTLRFPQILYAREHPLTGVSVRGSRVAFRIDNPKFRLEFEGKRKGDALSGRCKWVGAATYAWTAERAAEKGPQPRFDEGLRFDRDWPRGEDTGLDGEALDRLLAAAEEAGSDALIVLKDGRVACERYFRGNHDRIHLMSVTKFFTAMAIALLIEDGRIESLDAPLSTWFPAWKEGPKAKVTLRHVLAHTSGIHNGRDAGGRPNARALNEAPDKVAFVLGQPLDDEPGTRFAYNNEAIALLSGVVTQAAGKPADAYLDEKLFRPLGIRDYAWDRDRAGNTITYAQLQMKARDVARVGLLVAHQGKWKGQTLFPERWIRLLGDAAGSDLKADCGLVWWRLEEPRGYYHTGYLGQWLVVFPDADVVAVRLRAWDGGEDPARELGGFLSLLRGTLPEKR